MSQKAVLITGASTGIGEQTAYDLAKAGFHVFAAVRKTEDGDKLKKNCPANLTPVLLDVTKPEQIRARFLEIQSLVGEQGLWGLVNNAGIAVAGPLEYLTVQDLREQFDVNVFGLHDVTHVFLPLIRKAKGRVVHVGSIAGRFTFPFVAPYSASKHALESLSDGLRREMAPFGVQVALVEPGRIITPIWDKSQQSNLARRDRLSPLVTEHYGQVLENMQRETAKSNTEGIPASKVSKAINHALTACCAKTRYVVGADAKIQAFLSKFAPDRFIDWLVRKILKY